MMAGYRPKSLDELNSIFDKTMAAEKAIKKGSSLLEKGEDIFSSFSADIKEESLGAESDGEIRSTEISDSVSEFIAKFSAPTDSEPVKAKPKMTVISPEVPKKEFEIVENVFADEADAPVREPEKPSRDELFDEYMKIMSDEDDESLSEKKLSRKEKKRLRKKEKAQSLPVTSEAPAENTEEDEEVPFEPSAEEAPTDDTPEEPIYAEETFQPEAAPEEGDDFDFPENYTPEWIKEEAAAEEKSDEKPLKKKGNGVKALLKVILSLVLVAVISIAALATVFKTVVAVNTGKLVSDRYYVFTTYRDYTELGLSEGTLVITEKEYAEDGEVFAYVDYSNKTFEFGRRTDSITKEDGEMLYVTEKDGGRVLVSRDDCKGVVHLTYEGRGELVSLMTDNYIVIVAAAAVISLIIVLLFALVLRTKREDKIIPTESPEAEASEETEDEFEDIFSTIE